jgi:hypothetical protein
MTPNRLLCSVTLGSQLGCSASEHFDSVHTHQLVIRPRRREPFVLKKPCDKLIVSAIGYSLQPALTNAITNDYTLRLAESLDGIFVDMLSHYTLSGAQRTNATIGADDQ